MKRLIQYSEGNALLRDLRNRVIPMMLMLFITLGIFSQSALARNTYVITDGSTVVVHTTFSTDPSDVLLEAGVQLGNADTVTTTTDSDGTSEIVVSRSNTVLLDNGGRRHAVSTTAETVGELLEQYNIEVTDDTVLTTSPASRIYNNMELGVSTLTYGEELVEEPIAHEEITCAVSWLDEGETFVAVSGQDGLQETRYDVTYENGTAIRRTAKETTVITEPIDQVTYVGAGASTAAYTFTESGESGSVKTLTTANGDELAYTTVLSCEATAYTCEGSSWNRTATGTTARVGCIAVDPNVIALGTRVYVETADGSFIYGCATAEDTGGAIKGNIIDLYFDTEDECWNFGRRAVNVYILA